MEIALNLLASKALGKENPRIEGMAHITPWLENPHLPAVFAYSHYYGGETSFLAGLLRMTNTAFPVRGMINLVRPEPSVIGLSIQKINPLNEFVYPAEFYPERGVRDLLNAQAFQNILQRTTAAYPRPVVTLAPDGGISEIDGHELVDPLKVKTGGIYKLLTILCQVTGSVPPLYPIAVVPACGAVHIGDDISEKFLQAEITESGLVVAEAINCLV